MGSAIAGIPVEFGSALLGVGNVGSAAEEVVLDMEDGVMVVTTLFASTIPGTALSGISSKVTLDKVGMGAEVALAASDGVEVTAMTLEVVLFQEGLTECHLPTS